MKDLALASESLDIIRLNFAFQESKYHFAEIGFVWLFVFCLCDQHGTEVETFL
ncbi:hypothetical protein KR52_01515 [Synechococcus sp. KORDI-52]|nr:hypothetical protein KR52_01515 [Synechococcus sp. KORDI-52]